MSASATQDGHNKTAVIDYVLLIETVDKHEILYVSTPKSYMKVFRKKEQP